ncbi:S41 family peptidase [Sulfurisphaera javensis]|uniref:S41 family peptidase n=1 Tax=Sulfurisphaera javensis TaxID=2049879 RepID=UPI0034E86D29
MSFDNSKTFKKFLSLNGIISWPIIINNRVYFLYDNDGKSNLYSVNLDGSELRQHTFLEYCRNASSDGKLIVFQHKGDLYLFNPQKDELRKLDISIFTDRKKRKPHFVSTFDYITDGKIGNEYLAIVSRGKVFIMKPFEGPAYQLGEKQGVKYYSIQVTPDGKVIATNDKRELLILSLDGEKKINVNLGRIESMKISPDGKKLLVSNNKLELWLVELDSGNAKLIDKSEYGIITEMDWHPNSEWFAYSFPEGPYTRSIKLGNVSGKIIRITSPYGDDFSPSFDPDGRYLYFLSVRHLDPTADKVIFNMSFQKAIKPYLVTLANVYSPFNQPLEEIKDKKEIEIEGIQDRVIPFPVDEDVYVKIEGAKGNKVFLLTFPVKGNLSQDETLGKLLVYDLDNESLDTYLENVRFFSLSLDKSKILVQLKDGVRLFDVSTKPDLNAQGKKGGVVDLSRVKVLVDPEKEWKQMLSEAWELIKENYWNEKRLNNWDEVINKYLPLVDRISTRFELADLINEMQGEAKTSHSYQYVYSYETDDPLFTYGLGAEVKFENGCFKITRIYKGDPTNENERSPLRDPGVQLEEGDCIVSIDGESITYRQIEYYLMNKENVTLDVITKDGKKRRVYVRLLKNEKYLLYRDWVERNREYVHEKTNNKVGYIHIPDMMFQGFAEFYRLFVSEFDKEGLIVDARFNRGGFISGLILSRLLLKRQGEVVSRNRKPIPEPYMSSPPKLVEVVNEYAGSDGDIFTYLFKKYKLGVVIGKRTWGGVIGISLRHTLADRTVVTQPEHAVHFYEIGLQIENQGVEPDIEVDIPPGEKRDLQLDKAIEMISGK